MMHRRVLPMLSFVLSGILLIGVLFVIARFMHGSGTRASEHIMAMIVGKKNTSVGFFKIDDKKLKLLKELEFPTASITNFNILVKQILNDAQHEQGINVSRVCIGAPGKSSEHHDTMAPHYLPFVINTKELQEHTRLKYTKVVNDFELIGYGLPYLEPEKVVTLYDVKKQAHALSALIGVGEGVGSSFIIQDCHGSRVYPLGYCYTNFAVTNEQDFDLMSYFKQRSGKDHMSWGYALGSTGGLTRIYDFFTQKLNQNALPTTLDMQAIFDSQSHDPIAEQASTIYMSWYIKLLRTVALTQLPYNGLYITSSLALKKPELFMSSNFLEEYFNSGHEILHDVLADIPLYLVLEPKASLYGAAAYAFQLK